MPRRSQVDQRLAEELSRGATLTKAAEAAGCSEATAKRRWREPTFRDLVIQLQTDARREREALLHASWHLGVRLVPVAMAALQETLQDHSASHLDKARAARILLRSFGPREEPPAPHVPSLAQEQQAAAMAAQVAQLLARANVVDLDAHRPADRQPPPAAEEPTWTPPPPAWPDPDDDEEKVAVGLEYAKTAPPEPVGPPNHRRWRRSPRSTRRGRGSGCGSTRGGRRRGRSWSCGCRPGRLPAWTSRPRPRRRHPSGGTDASGGGDKRCRIPPTRSGSRPGLLTWPPAPAAGFPRPRRQPSARPEDPAAASQGSSGSPATGPAAAFRTSPRRSPESCSSRAGARPDPRWATGWPGPATEPERRSST